MGSLIALRIALAHPSRVTALALLACLATAASPEGIALINQVRDIWVSTPTPSEDIMNAAIRGWGGDPDVTGPRAQRIKRDWVDRHSGAENIDEILESLNVRDDIRPRLGEIKTRVLIMNGELDETWKLEEREIVRDGMVNADVKFEVVKGSGHLVVYTRDSEDVSRMIGDFVREVLDL
jgi:3-oxoadipate enol-lactonase